MIYIHTYIEKVFEYWWGEMVNQTTGHVCDNIAANGNKNCVWTFTYNEVSTYLILSILLLPRLYYIPSSLCILLHGYISNCCIYLSMDE